MSDWLRLTLALIFFSLGIYCCIDLFISGFDIIVLIAALICFLIAHYLKPRQSEDDAYTITDALDLMLDIPYRAIVLALRGVGKLLKGGVDSVDL